MTPLGKQFIPGTTTMPKKFKAAEPPKWVAGKTPLDSPTLEGWEEFNQWAEMTSATWKKASEECGRNKCWDEKSRLRLICARLLLEVRAWEARSNIHESGAAGKADLPFALGDVLAHVGWGAHFYEVEAISPAEMKLKCGSGHLCVLATQYGEWSKVGTRVYPPSGFTEVGT